MLLPESLIIGATSADRPGSLPEILGGLITLAIVLNVCVILQHRDISRALTALAREASRADTMEQFAFINPRTQLFVREYLKYVLPIEIEHANRYGKSLTFLMMSMQQPETTAEKDEFMVHVARILRSTFRGSDSIIQYGRGSLVVVLPETSEGQAAVAVKRLLDNVDRWNLNTKTNYEILLNHAMAPYAPGADPFPILQCLEERVAFVGWTERPSSQGRGASGVQCCCKG
ncbi:MAG TPA: diguanylate cyclase [Terriglobales bacterium]|nr:diguanylate cyclase [Terriglobales bacterium]